MSILFFAFPLVVFTCALIFSFGTDVLLTDFGLFCMGLTIAISLVSGFGFMFLSKRGFKPLLVRKGRVSGRKKVDTHRMAIFLLFILAIAISFPISAQRGFLIYGHQVSIRAFLMCLSVFPLLDVVVWLAKSRK